MIEALIAVFIVSGLVLLLLAIERQFIDYRQPVPAPKALFVTQVRGNSMSDTLTYEVVVGSPAASDVVSRELTVVVDGVYKDPVLYSADVLNLGQVTVPQDSEVVVSVVDIDDAGNRSEPATLVFTALDVVPPPAPGGVSVVLVGENLQPEVPVVPVSPEVAVTPEAEVPADETVEPEADDEAANG